MEYCEDAESAEASELDSEDDLEREELEIALYSQIHFEENTDTTLCTSQQQFTYLVEGNSYVGYKATETTSQLLLDRHLNCVIPGNEIIPNRDGKRRNTYAAPRSTVIEKEGNKGRDHLHLSSSNKKQTSAFAASRHDVDSSVTEAKLKRSKTHSKRKHLAEELILNIDSGSDSDFITISDDNNEYSTDDEDSDSEESNIDGLLDVSDVDDSNLQINMHLGQRAHQDLRYDNTFNGSKERLIDSPSLKRSVTRYYKPTDTPKTKVCCLCSEPGHGHFQCPQSLCYNCDEPGHDAKGCTQPRRKPFTVCFRCRMRGHDQKKCPELWRQYHLTTSLGELQLWKVKRRRKRMYCFNCAGDDHYGHECQEDRMSRYVCVTSPFITRYQDDESYNGSNNKLSSKGKPSETKTSNTAPIVKSVKLGASKHAKGAKPVESGTSKPVDTVKQIGQETRHSSTEVNLAKRVTAKPSTIAKPAEDVTIKPPIAGSKTDRVSAKSSTLVKPKERVVIKSLTVLNSTESTRRIATKATERLTAESSTEVNPTEVVANESSIRVNLKDKESSSKVTSQNGFKLPQKELSKFLPSSYVNDKRTGRSNFDKLRQQQSQQKVAKINKCVDLTEADSAKSKKRKAKKSGKSEVDESRNKKVVTELDKGQHSNIEGEATINVTLFDSDTSHEHFLRTSNSSGSGYKKMDESYNRTTGAKAMDMDRVPKYKGSGKKAKKRKPVASAAARDIDMGEEDLFSWRKVKQVRGQLGHMDEVEVSEEEKDELQHQAFNNQWWENKQSKKKGKGRRSQKKR